jgi:hypothetical protein
LEWQDVDILLPVGPVNTEEIKQRYGVNRSGSAGKKGQNFAYFPCRRNQRGGCEFRMRWAKQGGLLQQYGQHNHGVEK